MRLGVVVAAAALAVYALAVSDSKAQSAQDAAIEGLAIVEPDYYDSFWYMYGRLPRKMNIEVDDVVRRVLERLVGAPGPARGEFQIDERQWFHSDAAGGEVYERCLGGFL
ncbi:hypothetical protein Pisl_1359 [Pyrobaculum islandicum DSM 4184]|uniref:Uncharacterized protein n=1 Tax=Pyrobaculum islandicum (strain DSM 4184 / JCM 9189 / GEO3) TaxID=384616 RepID=A1RU89_PYRIL|nr:hypothetical protein [Pyrobaculum islandicum]ABL88521.1 hypothetical protein Pisl_1359 [Pyrobaculum islandicum DSM 4184]